MRSDRELSLELYRYDFLSFLSFVFCTLHPGRRYVHNWHLDVMADELMQCSHGGNQRLIINVPPRSLKSISASIAWPIFLLAREPGLRICVYAGTRELASDFHALRLRLLADGRFRAIFPHMKFKEITDGMRFEQGGELVQVVVGRSQVSRGADIILIDDPISPTHAQKYQHREQVNLWYDSEIVPRLNNKASAAVIVVMQRLHPHDLTGHLLQSDGQWRHLELSAVQLAEEVWSLSSGGRYVRQHGDALCPQLESKDALKGILNQIGALKFYAQYLQDPRPPAEQESRVKFFPMQVDPEWRQGMPTSHGGFRRVRLANKILLDYFDIAYPNHPTGKRQMTEDEFEIVCHIQQDTLLASSRQQELTA